MNVDTARDDLAFMRALVEPDDQWQRQFGLTYTAAGACYCIQMALHAVQFLGALPTSGPIALAIGLGPTIVFMAILLGVISRRGAAPRGSATAKAVGSVFGAVGLTNLVLIAAIGSIAWRLGSLTVWLIYPCVVMILQGMAWLVVYMMRRRGWLAVVAGGWFAVGVAMAASIQNVAGYVAAAGLGMFAFMLLPGLFVLRQANRSL
jgi:hypothetical protein